MQSPLSFFMTGGQGSLTVTQMKRLLPFLLLLVSLATTKVGSITRDDFPAGFVFGAGTSAFQVKQLINNLLYASVSSDFRRLIQTGRFSISWSRLIPDGRGQVNPKGLQYYNNLINELISNGIQPHVTLHHFDLPQVLQDEYGGQLSPKIVEDFTAYADLCFKEFGDRVKHWSTFNEPNIETVLGHDVAVFPPGRCSYPFGINCSEGDSRTEPYISAHNLLLAHASAATLYKKKYQPEQRGQIGITLLGAWAEPLTNTSDDVSAAKRMMEFHLGWFLRPLVYGDYPAIMKDIVRSRLPSFSKEESRQLKASFDFLGLNHYGVMYVQSNPNKFDFNERDYFRDVAFKLPDQMNELPGMEAAPWGLNKILEYIKVNYRNPPIFIHENGYAKRANNFKVPGYDFDDQERVNYLKAYIESLPSSIRNGSNAVGYFVWSFIDCYEFFFGYTIKYGLYGVDFNKNERTRYPHLSAQWYSDFLLCGEERRVV